MYADFSVDMYITYTLFALLLAVHSCCLLRLSGFFKDFDNMTKVTGTILRYMNSVYLLYSSKITGTDVLKIYNKYFRQAFFRSVNFVCKPVSNITISSYFYKESNFAFYDINFDSVVQNSVQLNQFSLTTFFFIFFNNSLSTRIRIKIQYITPHLVLKLHVFAKFLKYWSNNNDVTPVVSRPPPPFCHTSFWARSQKFCLGVP